MRANPAARAALCVVLLAAGSRLPAQRTREMTSIEVPAAGAALHVEYDAASLPVSKAALVRWISRAARAVAVYFGRFPVARARILVVSGTRGKVGSGFTAYATPFTRVVLGEDTTESDLESDWVMTHELVHLAHPSLGKPWAWMEEGVATYVEPIARARGGMLPEDEVWRWLIDGLPKGLPHPGDEGLDRTHTWGRTYWGGALYCFLADLEIRRETGDRSSLGDALRGVLNAGGDVRATWSLEEMISAGDRATGLPVLAHLHARLGSSPVFVDLPALFRQLGVAVVGGRVVYDDTAPLAAVRRSIAARPAL